MPAEQPLLSLTSYFLLLGVLFVVLSNLFAIYLAQLVRSSFDLVAGHLKNLDQLKDEAARTQALDVLKDAELRNGFLIVAGTYPRAFSLFHEADHHRD